MATIVEHIFSYQLDNKDVPRPTVEQLLAYAETASNIIVSWNETVTDTNYVVFEYIRSDQTFDPVSSPGKILCLGGKVEPKTYSCPEFMKLIEDARVIRFKYSVVSNFVRPAFVADECVSYSPNYPHMITELEKKGLVTTFTSACVFCDDPRRFTICGESESYAVDYLGTKLCTELSRRIEELYISSFQPSLKS